MHLAQTDVPSFRHIERNASANKIQENIEKINEIIENIKIGSKLSTLSKADILTSSLETKIDQNIAKIDEIVSSLNGDDMNKSLKNIAAGAALLGAAATTTAADAAAPKKMTSTESASQPAISQTIVKQPHPTYEQNKKIIARLRVKNPLLAAIADYESSGGKFLDHRTISDKDSMHYGHTAGSMFGLMPHSVAEVFKKSKQLKQKYPVLSELSKDVGSNHKKITERLNASPNMATEIASQLLFMKGKKFDHDASSTAHAWNKGIQGTLDKLSSKGIDAITSDDYVTNVMSRMGNLISHKSKPSISVVSKDIPSGKKPNLNKALTAGYGGAGSPTAMTGGSVLQSESLNMSPSDLRSVVCDRCGKEQIYAKYQTKCRSCNSPFSLEKIYRVIGR
jgi:ribosomal protein L12E/L44/L45/RPP1/RPP2